jgi:hypothetical protein
MSAAIDGLKVMEVAVVAPLILGFVAYAAMKTYASQGLDIAGYHIIAESIKNYTAWTVVSGFGATVAGELLG